MAYWSDVKYIDESDPGLIDVNAEEFKRLVRLADTALPELASVKAGTEWDGAGRAGYDRKLDDATRLLQYLREAFATAGTALVDYVPEIRKAQGWLRDGVLLQNELAELLENYQSGHTQNFHGAEPLRQWEDLRESTGFRDWLSDPRTINDNVEHRATQLHDEIHRIFDDAKNIEENARSSCVPALRRAYALLPDYRSDSDQANSIIERTPGLRQEMARAATSPDVRLSGLGQVPEYLDEAQVSAPVSAALQELRHWAAALPGGDVTWNASDSARWNIGVGETEEEFKLHWLRDNREVIKAAAHQYGLPADVLGGIAYKEVGGKPLGLDSAADWSRHHLPDWVRDGTRLEGPPDQTSYGPLAVQAGRAAEALGYDPESLSEQQRQEIVTSLENPKENIFIAAKHLSDLKQSSEFALTDPDQITPQQGQELAARYNGGSNWRGDQAQAYAQDYAAHRASAAEELR